MSRSPDPSQTTSFLSVSRKREALWNVLQPGDPYDIRKSMIVKVPGDKKGFMGEHLQIVCLFQAAEIERLCEFLEDFKLRYRQIERRQLDRHSYEVQIQQLNHKLAQEFGFRQENQKLKDFIKNQGSNKQGVEDSIKSKYEKLLLQIKSYEDQNNRLKRQKDQYQSHMSSFDAKFQALQKSKQTQMDEMYLKFNQQGSMSSNFQMNSLKSQYESELQRLDLQNKRIKNSNQERLRQLQNWQQKYRVLQQQALRVTPKNDSGKYERQITEYQNRFVIFGQQIDRLNLVIKQITYKFQVSEQRNKEYEKRYDILNKQFQLFQSRPSENGQQITEFLKRISGLEDENRKLQQSSSYLADYEYRLKQLSEQCLRLGNQLKLEIDNGNRYKNQIQRYQYEESRLKILQKQVIEYKQAASQNNSLKRNVAEYQNKILIINQQLQRLRQQNFKKNGEDRTLIVQYQGLQRKLSEWERNYQVIVQQYESKISQKNNQYQSRIQNINRTKGYEFESKAAALQNEVQRLGQILRRKNQQVQNYQKQIRQLQYTITSKYQVEATRKIKNYESEIQHFKRQNQDLIKKIRELQPLQRRVNEYENKSTITLQEIERLNQQLRAKDNEIENMKRQIREQEIAIVQKYEMDTSRKLGNFEQNLNNVTRQNQEWKRKYTEMQNKAALVSQEIERLSNNHRQLQMKNNNLEQQVQRLQRLAKESQINITNRYEFQVNQKVTNYETVIRNNQRQVEQLRRRIQQLENSNRKLVQYESRLSLMTQQLERLGIALRQKQQQLLHSQNNNQKIVRQFEDLGRKYNELQVNVRNKYEVQTTRTITTLEQNITVFKRQNDQLKKYIQEYEGRLKEQNGDLENLSINLRNLAQQNEGLKRQIRDIDSSYRNKLEVQVTGKYSSYQTNISQIRKQLDNVARQNNQLKRVLQNAQQTNIRINQQNQGLRKKFQQDFGEVSKRINEYELKINQLQGQNQVLKRKVNQLEILIRQKYEIEASRRISSLDQNLANSNQQNEELKRRLEIITRQFQQLRRVTQNMERDNQELAKKLREFGQINRKVGQYENKISLLVQELQRTNNNLRAKVQDLNKAERHIQELTRQLQNFKRNMSQSQSSVQQFQLQVKARITQYQQSITVLTQQNSQLKRRLHILDDMNRKIAEYENKIVILNQQLQRVNINLRNQVQKSNQVQNALRNSAAQNDDLKRKFVQFQNTVSQKYQVQATRAIRTLQQNIEALQRQNGQLKGILHEFQQKGNNQNLELQRLNGGLKNMTQENNMLKNQLRQTEISITRKYESQVTTKYTSYERDITTLKRDNQQLVRNIRELTQRVIPQYQNQVVILKQQIQRLNQYLKQQSGQLTLNLKNLGQQNDALKRQIQELHLNITHKYEVEVNKKYSSYEQSITGLQRENEELKRYIQQLGGKYEGQLKGINQNFNLLQKQNQQLRRSIQQISLRYESEIKKTGSFEHNLSGLGRQNEQLKRRLNDVQTELQRLGKIINELQQQNELIRRQAQQGEVHITQKYQSETSQQINIYKQQITQIENNWQITQRENQELQRRINDLGGDSTRKLGRYQEQLKQFSLQIQRLNGGIREYDQKLRQLTAQNQSLLRRGRETQAQLTHQWQSQFNLKAASYQQTIQTLHRQLQQRQKGIYQTSNKRIMQLQNKVVLVSQQFQRLSATLKGKNQQNQKMRAQIERLNNTLRIKMQEGKHLDGELHKLRSATQTEFGQMQASYAVITRENQNYKKHLTDYETSIKKLYAEFQRLQNIINDLKKEREALFEKNYALSNEIDRLLTENKDLEVQVEDVRLRLSDEAALHKRINQHMALMVVLFAEIQSLRKRVKDKEKQVQEVRRSSLAPFKLQSRARVESL